MRVVLFYPKTPVHENPEWLESLVWCQACSRCWMDVYKRREKLPQKHLRDVEERVTSQTEDLSFITPHTGCG